MRRKLRFPTVVGEQQLSALLVTESRVSCSAPPAGPAADTSPQRINDGSAAPSPVFLRESNTFIPCDWPAGSCLSRAQHILRGLSGMTVTRSVCVVFVPGRFLSAMATAALFANRQISSEFVSPSASRHYTRAGPSAWQRYPWEAIPLPVSGRLFDTRRTCANTDRIASSSRFTRSLLS